MVKKFFSKSRLIAAAVVMVFAVAATSVAFAATNKSAEAAASCSEHADKVNIVYKGIDCSTLQSTIDAFKSKYNTNKSGHAASPTVKKDYTDLQTVYNWTGASKSLVDGMTTKNAAMGTLYKDGRITVNGETVGTDAWVTARFSGASGYTHVTGNVYARKTTTSFAQSSAKVLVVYKANGQVAFAVMVDCGNGVKVTPKPPKEQPKPVYSCDLLTLTKKTDVEYNYAAKATAKNATIVSYVFDYGDQKSDTVTTAAATANSNHTYAKPGDYTATVTVNMTVDGQAKKITSAKCAVQIKIAQPECKPGIPEGDKRCVEECKPGVPMGDARCNECKEGIPVGDIRCVDTPETPVTPETPTVLPNTGAGSAIGLFSGFSIAGTAAHRLFSRRRNS